MQLRVGQIRPHLYLLTMNQLSSWSPTIYSTALFLSLEIFTLETLSELSCSSAESNKKWECKHKQLTLTSYQSPIVSTCAVPFFQPQMETCLSGCLCLECLFMSKEHYIDRDKIENKMCSWFTIYSMLMNTANTLNNELPHLPGHLPESKAFNVEENKELRDIICILYCNIVLMYLNNFITLEHL